MKRQPEEQAPPPSLGFRGTIHGGTSLTICPEGKGEARADLVRGSSFPRHRMVYVLPAAGGPPAPTPGRAAAPTRWGLKSGHILGAPRPSFLSTGGSLLNLVEGDSLVEEVDGVGNNKGNVDPEDIPRCSECRAPPGALEGEHRGEAACLFL